MEEEVNLEDVILPSYFEPDLLKSNHSLTSPQYVATNEHQSISILLYLFSGDIVPESYEILLNMEQRFQKPLKDDIENLLLSQET